MMQVDNQLFMILLRKIEHPHESVPWMKNGMSEDITPHNFQNL